MIAFLEGTIEHKGPGHVVIDVGGVGYEVAVATSTLAALPAAGKRTRLPTRLIVREDAMTIYGFTTPEQRDVFDLLTGISGVGPKVALAFLSALEPEAIRRAVVSGDVATLTIVPGVGKKMAQRVVLDLRDKLGAEDHVVVVDGPLVDVREALLSLGLSAPEAAEAMRGLESDGRAADELLREALQRVGR